MLPGTSQMTYHDLKILTIQETVKEYCQRYHDRLEYRSINLIFHS